ncbi:hypothetical protein L596_022357 [Steinernema carpocapsae]|uniref:Uncharacterized protein n=1 Tax=Steinernema carpocapsae TaxID=34508 RepID=A0A4U5MLG3_STECR|nr:hypothetical protein L596_022357 [Steinernema carpocapsae]
MAISPSNVLKLLVMRFPGHQSTENYSNFEEEIANGLFDYLEDIMEDRGDQLVKAFSEDDDDVEVSDDEDGTSLERFHGYNRKQMSQIVENWFVRKHKFDTIKSKFRKVRQTTTEDLMAILFCALHSVEIEFRSNS